MQEVHTMIRFETTLGDFTVELDEESAPISCRNFLRYVDDGYFADTIFHRVIPGFMVQGGGFTADMKQKPTHEPITNEADNGLRNRLGTIAMARTNDLHSATAQFFINLVDNGFLDHRPGNYGYAVFGRVAAGMDVIDKIAAAKTGRRGGHEDVPLEPVVIKLVRRTSAA
jgi:cyclophilin family peptidyl-prolyl cis-trans isomerase